MGRNNDPAQAAFTEGGDIAVDDVDDDGPIPFGQIEEEARVELTWTSPHSDEEQWASGEVTDVDVFQDEYGVEDGTPYVLIDPSDEDRDLRVSPAYGGQVESVTYQTVSSGTSRRIGDLEEIQVVDV